MDKDKKLQAESAIVYNIERFAIEDGPGIRTVVFLKGCRLTCEWCANPESQSYKTEILYNKNFCNGCGACIKACKYDAIVKDKIYGLISNPDKCVKCGACVDACLYNARTLLGETMTVDKLVQILLKDLAYYKKSGGGITFSGGEPLVHSEFIRTVSIKLKTYNIPVLVETSGEISKKNINDILDVIDTIYVDIKHMNKEKHKLYTGKSNEQIFENIKYIDEYFHGKIIIRYPYIPEKNDKLEIIDQMIVYVNGLTNIEEIVFLPYHRLGLPKYLGLGREYEMSNIESLKRSDLSHLLERYEGNKIPVRIG